jgi:hypothetical protein
LVRAPDVLVGVRRWTGLATDRDGTAYVTDTGLERVFRARDLDSDQSITLVAEEFDLLHRRR